MTADVSNSPAPSTSSAGTSPQPVFDPSARALACGLAGFAAGLVVQAVLLGRLPSGAGWRLALALVPLHLAALGGAAAGLLRGAPPRHWLPRCGFGVLSTRVIGQAFGGALVAWALVSFVQAGSVKVAQGLGLSTGPQGAFVLLTALISPAARAAAGLAVVLWVPLAEEILFRRVLTDALGSAGWRRAGLCSAVAFAAAHGSLVQAPALLLLAIILQRLRRLPGGLWAPVLAHSAFNALSLLGWCLG